MQYIYQPEGVGGIADEVLAAQNGRYFFEYQSESLTDFGNAYIPVQVEVLYYRRTGRGGSGYFPPSEY